MGCSRAGSASRYRNREQLLTNGNGAFRSPNPMTNFPSASVLVTKGVKSLSLVINATISIFFVYIESMTSITIAISEAFLLLV